MARLTAGDLFFTCEISVLHGGFSSHDAADSSDISIQPSPNFEGPSAVERSEPDPISGPTLNAFANPPSPMNVPLKTIARRRERTASQKESGSDWGIAEHRRRHVRRMDHAPRHHNGWAAQGNESILKPFAGMFYVCGDSSRSRGHGHVGKR